MAKLTKEELEKQIISQCQEGGFLVLLIANVTFDDDKYRLLVESLEEYDVLLNDSETINRYLAGCLLHLETLLGNAVFMFADLEHPNEAKVASAHARISDLVHRILVPPAKRGSEVLEE